MSKKRRKKPQDSKVRWIRQWLADFMLSETHPDITENAKANQRRERLGKLVLRIATKKRPNHSIRWSGEGFWHDHESEFSLINECESEALETMDAVWAIVQKMAREIVGDRTTVSWQEGAEITRKAIAEAEALVSSRV